MDKTKRRIDHFAAGVRADKSINRDGRFNYMSDNDIVSFFNTNFKYNDHTEWIEPPRNPGFFGSAWQKGREFKAKVPTIVRGTYNSIKDGAVYVNPSHLQDAKQYKAYLDNKEQGKQPYKPGTHRGRTAPTHQGREMREFISLASYEELEKSHALAMERDNESRKQDAKNYMAHLESANEFINNDPQLQAAQQWWDENPYEGFADFLSSREKFGRGLMEFATSFVPIAASGVIGTIVAGPPGGAAAAYSMGYNLEAGNHFESAFKIATDEMGLEPEEAYMVAAENARLYGAGSGFLEALVPGGVAKSLVLPKTLNKKLMSLMMKDAHQGIKFGGKSMTQEGYREALQSNWTRVWHNYSKTKLGLSNSKSFKEGVWNAMKDVGKGTGYAGLEVGKFIARMPAKGLKEVPLEMATEAAQFILEEAMTEGKLLGEELDQDWLKEKLKSQGFKDAVSLAMYTFLVPGGGMSNRNTGKSPVGTKDNATQDAKGNRIVFTGNPIEDGRWETATEEEQSQIGIPFKEDTPEVLNPIEKEIASYFGSPKERPKTDADGEPITNLSDNLLQTVIKHGWAGIQAIESAYNLDGENRERAIQMLGVALTNADTEGVLNLTTDSDGKFNSDEVRMTLRGIAKHGGKIEVQKEEAAIGEGTAKTPNLTFNLSEGEISKAVEELQNPIKSFRTMNIEALVKQEAEQPPTGDMSTGSPTWTETNQTTPQAHQEYQNMENSKHTLPNEEQYSDFDRIGTQYQEDSIEDSKNNYDKLKAQSFKNFVEEGEFDTEGLDKNKDGSISSNAKNKRIIWDAFTAQQNYIMEEKHNLNWKRNEEETSENEIVDNETNESAKTKTNNVDDTDGSIDKDVPNNQKGGINDNTNFTFKSQIELQEGEPVQPKAYDRIVSKDGETTFVATPEAQASIERLTSHFGDIISGEAVQQVYDENGQEVAGKAMGELAQWSQDKSRLDDIPHEHFHVYLNIFENAPIIQQALKKFARRDGKPLYDGTVEGNAAAKELLTEMVGNYYAGRIQDKGLAKRLKVWIRQAWLKFKKAFANLSESEMAEIIGEKFFQGKREKRNLKEMQSWMKVWYSQIDEENSIESSERNEDGHPEEIGYLDNLKNDATVHSEHVYYRAFGTYLPKSYIARDIPTITQETETFEEFKERLHDDVINKFDGTIVNAESMEAQIKTLWQQNKSKIPVAAFRREVRDDDGEIVKDDTGRTLFEVIDNDLENGRIKYEMVFSNRFGKELFEGFNIIPESNHIRRGVKNPTTFLENFMELQSKELGDNVRFMYMSLKDVVKYIQSHDYPNGFWTDNPRQFKLNKGWAKIIDKEFASRYANGDTPFLPFFFVTKAGDNQQMILSAVPIEWQGSQQQEFNGEQVDVTAIDRDFYVNELEAQVDAGFITKKQKDEMVEDADSMSKELLKRQDRPKLFKGKSPIGLKIKAITSKKKRDGKGDIVAAFFDRENKTINIDRTALKKKYKEKAWTKPKVKGVKPIAKTAFRSYQQFENFVIQHEIAHWTQPRQGKNESKAKYENRLNAHAFEMLNLAKKNKVNLKQDPFMANLRKGDKRVGSKLDGLAYAQSLGWFIRLQQTKGSNILMRNANLAEIVNRIRLDFSEGPVGYGSGDRGIMWMNTNDIEIRSPGPDGTLEIWDRSNPITNDDSGDDGTLWTGTRKLNQIANAFGEKGWNEVKTVIRHLNNTDNVHTYNDYMVVKMMETNPPPGTLIFKKGQSEPFIEVVGRGGDTFFRVLQGDQAGMEFDSFGTENEIKDTSGSYSETGVVHTLPETATKVLIKSKVPQTSAHPVTGHEMIMDDALYEMEEGVEYMSALEEYINTKVTEGMNKLLEFRNNPKALKDYLNRDLGIGEIPTDMQQWIELWENGEGLQHPEFLNQVVPFLNNQIMINGFLKLRPENGRGTKAFIKPVKNLNVQMGNAIISANQTVALNMAKQDYLKDKGITSEEAPWTNKHEMVKEINKWLADTNYLVLMHRQPIQGATKVEPRRVQQFIEGEGNAIHLHPLDTYTKQEADNDGDTVAIERPKNPRLIQSMDALTKTEYWDKRNKTISLKRFVTNQKKYKAHRRNDRGSFYEDNGNAMFSQGMSVNAKTVANVMSNKNLEFSDNTLPKDVSYQARKSNDRVIMDYIELDYNELLNGGEYDKITQDGDRVIARLPDKDGNLVWQEVPKENVLAVAGRNKKGELVKKDSVYPMYQETTFENELSTLLQMAVDNPKYGLLSEVGFSMPFLMTRVFKRSDGKPISGSQTKGLRMVYNAFKYSTTRRGKDIKQNSLEMGELLNEFDDLKNRYYDENGKLYSNEKVAENVVTEILSSQKRLPKIKKNKTWVEWGITSFKLDADKISPMEKLLITPSKWFDTLPQEIQDRMSGNIMETQQMYNEYAHVMTMKDFKKQIGDSFIKMQKNPKTQQEFKEALDFAEQISSDFYGIFERITKERGENAKAIKSIKYNYSQEFIEFTEKWQPQYDALSDLQKGIATYKFLSGSSHKNLKGKSTKKAFVLKLLPLSLMDKSVIQPYGQMFAQHLKDKDFKQVKTSDARYGMFMPMHKFNEILEQNKCG